MRTCFRVMRQTRLQARVERGVKMSPYEVDPLLEEIIRELTLRIVTLRWTEFDTVWEAAIRVCDRYELGKSKRANALVDQALSRRPGAIISSAAEPCAVDGPAQTLQPAPLSPSSPGYAPSAVPPSTMRRRDFSDY